MTDPGRIDSIASLRLQMSKRTDAFVLKNIQPNELDQRYKLLDPNDISLSTGRVSLGTNLSSFGERRVEAITPLAMSTNESVGTHTTSVTTLGDDSHTAHITMMDAMDQEGLPRVDCFWCRHAFNTPPIGCPVSYHPSVAVKFCRSEITRETYSIRQSIPRSLEAGFDNETYAPSLRLDSTAHYEVDGVFCSFECTKAFVIDHLHDALYARSEFLLSKMYAETVANTMSDIREPVELQCAPHWRLLTRFGGSMSIDEFRNATSHRRFSDPQYVVKHSPRVIPIGRVYLESMRF